jgi:hypothetical protein
VLDLLEGALLLLPAAPEGQDRDPNPRWHYQGRVEADRPDIGIHDELMSTRAMSTLAVNWTFTHCLSDTLLLG